MKSDNIDDVYGVLWVGVKNFGMEHTSVKIRNFCVFQDVAHIVYFNR
jgi:hypothetical protein